MFYRTRVTQSRRQSQLVSSVLGCVTGIRSYHGATSKACRCFSVNSTSTFSSLVRHKIVPLHIFFSSSCRIYKIAIIMLQVTAIILVMYLLSADRRKKMYLLNCYQVILTSSKHLSTNRNSTSTQAVPQEPTMHQTGNLTISNRPSKPCTHSTFA